MRRACVVVLLIASGSAMAAEDTTPSLVYPCCFAEGGAVVDGVMEETTWLRAPKASAFTMARAADELADPQTVFRVLWSRTHLILGMECFEPLMDKLVAKSTVHDGEVWFDDCLEIFLDPDHDHSTYFQLAANTLGTRFERSDSDFSWTAPWQAAARKQKDEWNLEVAIPFESLNAPLPSPGAVWGFNLCRERYAGGEQQLFNWSDTSGNFHSPRQFGHLAFVKEVDQAILGKLLQPLLREHPSLRACLEDGFLALRQGREPIKQTYRRLAEVGVQSPEADLNELRELVTRPAGGAYAPTVKELTERMGAVRKLLAEGRPLTAQEWIGAVTTSREIAKRMDSLKWEIKLNVLLNE